MNLEHIIAGLMIAGLMVLAGRDSADWARAHSISYGAAYWRAFRIVLAIALASHFLNHSGSRWLLTLLCIGAIFTAVGLFLQRWKYPGPRMARPFWQEAGDDWGFDFLAGYECWKCKKFKTGPWPYEARIQDREQKAHAFVWHPICGSCAEPPI